MSESRSSKFIRPDEEMREKDGRKSAQANNIKTSFDIDKKLPLQLN